MSQGTLTQLGGGFPQLLVTCITSIQVVEY